MADLAAQGRAPGIHLLACPRDLSLTIIAPPINLMSLPDLVIYRIVHYVLDASETDTSDNVITGGNEYNWSLSIFIVNKALYAHVKAVWESNHFTLVSANSDAFFYQFQQYGIPTAAAYFMSWIVEDRVHNPKCHLHIDIDIDYEHIGEIQTQHFADDELGQLSLAQDEAYERAKDIDNPSLSIDASSCKVFFVLCHHDLPDFARALREIDLAFTCRLGLRFDMRTRFSGTKLPLRVQHLLLEPFQKIRTRPGRCDIAGSVDTGLSREFIAKVTSTVDWSSAEVVSSSTDIYYLTAATIERADEEFLKGNVGRAATILEEAVDYWHSLRHTSASIFDDESEKSMVESFLYALSANQARLNLETTVRLPTPIAPRITRIDPTGGGGTYQGKYQDHREFFWLMEDFGNGRDSIAAEGFGLLVSLYQNLEYDKAFRISRRWLRRPADMENDEILQTNRPGMVTEAWRRRAWLQELVGLLPPHLCKPVFSATFDITQDVVDDGPGDAAAYQDLYMEQIRAAERAAAHEDDDGLSDEEVGAYQDLYIDQIRAAERAAAHEDDVVNPAA